MAVEKLGSLSRPGIRVRCIVLLCLLLTLGGVVYLGYFCPEKVCALTNARRSNGESTQLKSDAHLQLLGSVSGTKGSSNRRFEDQELLYESEYEKEILNLLVHQPAVRLEPSPYQPDTRPKVANEVYRGTTYNHVSFDDIHYSNGSDDNRFNIESNDVIVFLHIQKTGGTTFGRHLVHDLDLDKPCECRKKGKGQKKRCKCVRPNSDSSYWLFSRFSTGWQCGLHADWTELTNCVESVLDKEEGVHIKRRFFYITLLREPVVRFLSEFLHVQRGATWKTARHLCGGREAGVEELPNCYTGANWEDVSLEEFLACSSNLAINRQTRMLADLTLVGCYNSSVLPQDRREMLMLESAKRNLKNLAFFGLCENQHIAQYMFEETFKMNFLTNFQQFNETHVTSVLKDLSPEQLAQVRRLNHLDVELYNYAKDLLQKRFDRVRKTDPSFAEHYQMLYRSSSRSQLSPLEDIDSNR